jgi:hypothetical protein
LDYKANSITRFRLLIGITLLLTTSFLFWGIVLRDPSRSAASEAPEGLVGLRALDASQQPMRQLQGTHLVYFPLIAKDYCPVWPCLKFNDDFSNPASGWPHESRWGNQEDEREYIIGYYPGPWNAQNKYFMRIAHARRIVASPGLHAPGDYIIEADMMFCDDAYLASAGLVFGASDNLRQFYVFSLAYNNDDHWCAVRKYDLDGESPYLRPGEWSPCGANPEYEVNHLKVERIGTSIKVYVNDNPIWAGSDDSYTGERRVGFIHDKYEIGYTGVYFDNFKLWQVHPDDGSATACSPEEADLEPLIITWDEGEE